MLSKIFLTGKMFPETCRYVCEDLERAEVLDVEGVRAHDHRLMAFDFASQHQTRPEREKPVFHAALTFPHGEDPGDEKLKAIARDYLREIGMVGTQHVTVKHTDKEHLHLHIIANRVNNEGKTIGKGMIVDRGIDAARKLTQQYQLRVEKGKNLEKTNRSDPSWQARRGAITGFMRPYGSICLFVPADGRLREAVTGRRSNRTLSAQSGRWRAERISFKIRELCLWRLPEWIRSLR